MEPTDYSGMTNENSRSTRKHVMTRTRCTCLRPVWGLAIGLLTLVSTERAIAQTRTQMVRIAKIVVDPAQLQAYQAALKAEIDASVRLEPGVKTLYAVSEKNNPTHVTILEIYADSSAYKAHIQTPHFLTYKNGTKDMVKKLELVEVDPLVPGMKIKE